ncbi:cytochrome P450 [Auriculariales sp. MPI-PUGE-AT-0066]|nr:cytochrome P450 [Auriculariales sp. MPI-PUGE-AT-0066]
MCGHRLDELRTSGHIGFVSRENVAISPFPLTGALQAFEQAGTTIIKTAWPLPCSRDCFVADVEAIKIIFNNRHGFQKETQIYKIISFFGDNIVGVEGDQWVLHRSIARKSFNERNNALLWHETVSTLEQWFSEWDEKILLSKTQSAIVNITPALRDLTLFIIASAGFGMHFDRKTLERPAPGYTMSFGESLFVAIETMIVKVVTPRWMYQLPITKLQQSDTAYTELRNYIVDMIAAQRNGKQPASEASKEAADLFRRLVAANEEEGAFFLAGHDKVFREATAVWPDVSVEAEGQWATSSLSDYNQLEYTLAVFRETLRLFPPVVRTKRDATSDTALPSRVRDPQTGSWKAAQVAVPAALYWGEDVSHFRPERFTDTADYQWPRDAWIPFTAGPRVCLGQRFSTLESACIIARVVRRYRLLPPPELAGLSREQQRMKLTKWMPGVTATPGNVNLVFEPRN